MFPTVADIFVDLSHFVFVVVCDIVGSLIRNVCYFVDVLSVFIELIKNNMCWKHTALQFFFSFEARMATNVPSSRT